MSSTTGERYNGFENRSTWLARLHLESTSKELLNEAQWLGRRWNEMREYWEDILKRDPHSYSYPFHQHRSIQGHLKDLLKKTRVFSEPGFYFEGVNTKELFEAINNGTV